MPSKQKRIFDIHTVRALTNEAKCKIEREEKAQARREKAEKRKQIELLINSYEDKIRNQLPTKAYPNPEKKILAVRFSDQHLGVNSLNIYIATHMRSRLPELNVFQP